MFAIEIQFKDQEGSSEVLLVRRSVAVLGSSEEAHVELQDMEGLPFELQFVRDVGRRFKVSPIPRQPNAVVPSYLQNSYNGEASIDLGVVTCNIIALDIDLQLKEQEPPDRAGIRVLRAASTSKSPEYPALVVKTPVPFAVSFSPDQPILIGKNRQCHIRLDAAEISDKHARVGFESGGFWVEDLGSNGGTFIGGQQISGRANIPDGAALSLARAVQILGATASEQVSQAILQSAGSDRLESTETGFPLLLSLSEAARPARIVLRPGSTIVLGRDPSSDMWLGAPHVSRRHCEVHVSKAGLVSVVDRSTNGTAHSTGILRKGDSLEVANSPIVMDFGGNVTVGVCFSAQDELTFIEAGGIVKAFNPHSSQGVDGAGLTHSARSGKKTTTLFVDRSQKGSELRQNRVSSARRAGVLRFVRELADERPGILALVCISVALLVLVIGSLLLPVWR